METLSFLDYYYNSTTASFTHSPDSYDGDKKYFPV